MLKCPLAVAAVVLLAHAAQAQTPAGSNFQVNASTTGVPRDALVGVDRAGRFVVAWSADNGQDGSGDGVFARRFASDGAPLGGDLLVNVYTTGNQAAPSLAGDAKGGFVVSWLDLQRQGDVARRFDASGRPLGPDFPLDVNAFPTPRVAATPDGGFIVVWAQPSGPSNVLVLGRRYDAAGGAVGADFQVNTFTTGFQYHPTVAAGPAGHFVVAWQAADGSLYGIRAQRFAASGARLGGDFQVNTTTAGYQWWDAGARDRVMAVDRDGGFVVTWTSHLMSSPDSQALAQRFDAAGNRVGGEFRVAETTVRPTSSSRVAMDDGGNFVVTWTRNATTSDLDVWARRFDAGGAPRGAEFRVSNSLFAFNPQIASDPAGNLVVAWLDGDVAPGRARAQRYGGLQPSALAVDTADNGVLEPGETVDVRPAWRNVNGLAQTFSGTLARVTGPAGPTYTITDGAADYGTVADGATGGCGTNCYAVSVSGARPRPHWDAEVLEKIAPDSQGQNKAWPLHVGGSFTDVPRGSPFYRAVETLMHHGISGGCSATTFCPGASTTREQMAVFVLLAREGLNYLPPPCGTPLFSDVPASSAYCRWIEELARRGVTGGCDAGRFCPGGIVPRDQMAVFVLRTLDPALDPPACTTPVFNDVPASSPYCRWVEELARRGITGGCGGGSYCPAAAVAREQMSVFLATAFGLTLYGP